MRIDFCVVDLPPKKYTAQATSMWGVGLEAVRIVKLRRAALIARRSAGIEQPFDEAVSVSLQVFVHGHGPQAIGDLDNFISGVCDALQAADEKATVHKIFDEPENEDITPGLAILITDDALIREIKAEKLIVPEDVPRFCRIAVETKS